MSDDAQLLRRYVKERSQEAFAELVRRHVDMVYFAALRRVGGDAHLADDVAQTVFADLARKASSLGDRAVLTGWLYTSTRFAAAQAVRSERRRRTHEQEAQTMNELQLTPGPDWDQLQPIIDEAMDELGEHDREAVLLRFFEHQPFAEIGAKFSLSADAARMRVERALDRLRGLLARRGIGSTSAALAAAFASQAGAAAPATLVTRIVAGMVGQGGVATGSVVALWKILAAAAVVVGGIGLVAYQNPKEGRVPAVAASIAPVAPSAVAPVGLSALAIEEPVVTTTAPATAEVTAGVEAGGLDEFSARERNIIKNLWEHENISAGKSPSGWSFRPALTAPAAVVAEFAAAAERLRLRGLVGINPQVETVFLTKAGVDFCTAHAAEIDALQIATGKAVPIRFASMPAASKDILKTLWEHQKISPDQPPRHWGFKLPPDSPDYATFQLAAAGLSEVNGLVGIGAKTGVVFLNERGRIFCEAHAAEIDAYPLPVRTFRPVSAEAPAPASVP